MAITIDNPCGTINASLRKFPTKDGSMKDIPYFLSETKRTRSKEARLLDLKKKKRTKNNFVWMELVEANKDYLFCMDGTCRGQ
ncbi:hypothetical protein EUGRSUZ_A02750 [Eucalyptus grandis]|uniref:Uncharacterized protein n=2 Tax=Eucalyptus grandis TaxID=71139 RepID=A0ACC3M8I6_EUCGR|nr:hypothetical protein EUGRSUZ_A02750 [Eucalyptus grandis]